MFKQVTARTGAIFQCETGEGNKNVDEGQVGMPNRAFRLDTKVNHEEIDVGLELDKVQTKGDGPLS